jgi:hypothetical protein
MKESLFKTDGSLTGLVIPTISENISYNFYYTDPDEHGFWEESCGQQYMFGKILVCHN